MTPALKRDGNGHWPWCYRYGCEATACHEYREADDRAAAGEAVMTTSVDGIASDLAWKAYEDGIAAQDRRIDDDIALLVRAGVSLSRISMETHPDAERRLCVDGRPVQRYTITYTMEGR